MVELGYYDKVKAKQIDGVYTKEIAGKVITECMFVSNIFVFNANSVFSQSGIYYVESAKEAIEKKKKKGKK